MTEERFDVSTGKKVKSFDMAESINLAARLMASTDLERGIFALGVVAGMATASKRFVNPPDDKDIEDMTGAACMAQGCALLIDIYDSYKRKAMTDEVEKGPAFLQAKHANADRMIKIGREINENIDKFIKEKVDERVGQYEKTMVDGLKAKSEIEKKETEN